MSQDESPRQDRWNDRRVLAALVGLGVFLVPIACSIATVLIAEHFIAEPATVLGFGLWWAGVLLASTAVFVAAERVARRALPLAVLLKMGLLFPGQAPKRFAVARRAASTRDLHRQIDEARELGRTDEPTAAAERIVALAASLSAHDRLTRGHAERVRAYTDMIADELHLPRFDRDRLRWSALLHDIGKLSVHPEVLNKPGRLSPEEWSVMRRHPLEGARLIAPLADWLGPWGATVAEHHERFDGGGYPYGLVNSQISLGGRIVAVADSYDVMTSVRAYKKAMSPEVARIELAECANRQFDPQVVRAFLAVSLWRLRSAAPLSWLASMTVGNIAPGVARVGLATGHAALSGIVAGAGVLGLAVTEAHAATSTPSRSSPSEVTASGQGKVGQGSAVQGSAGQGSAGSPDSGTATTVAPRVNGGSDGATTTTTTPKKGSASTTTTSSGTKATKSTTTTTSGGAPAGSSKSTTTTTTTTSTTTTTTTAPPPPSPTTTTTTTTTTSTTTTTTTAPPPSPATGLSAKGSCSIIVLAAEVTLSWTASPTASVTEYEILRNSGDGFQEIGTVSGRTTTSYVDNTASGFGSSYTYEVVAVAPSGTATSNSASASTPDLCL